MLKRTPKREALFWAKVVKLEGKNACWEWVGCLSTAGYGRIGTDNKEEGSETFYAHQVSYTWFKRPIPDGKIIRHKCDNPKCIRPKHLQTGTYKQNSEDMVARDRHVGSREIDEIQAKRIRELRAKGQSYQSIACQYNFHEQHIQSICRGKYWPKAGGPIESHVPRSTVRITSELAARVKKSKAKGNSAKKVAAKFHIGVTTVYQIANGSYNVTI